MTNKMKKLDETQLKELYTKLHAKFSPENAKHIMYKKHVEKYFPETATSVVVTFNSEYNDEGYDCTVSYISVYDASGEEILPRKDVRKECREEWRNLPVPENEYGYGHEEALEDITIYLNPGIIPDLYVEDI